MGGSLEKAQCLAHTEGRGCTTYRRTGPAKKPGRFDLQRLSAMGQSRFKWLADKKVRKERRAKEEAAKQEAFQTGPNWQFQVQQLQQTQQWQARPTNTTPSNGRPSNAGLCGHTHKAGTKANIFQASVVGNLSFFCSRWAAGKWPQRANSTECPLTPWNSFHLLACLSFMLIPCFYVCSCWQEPKR